MYRIRYSVDLSRPLLPVNKKSEQAAPGDGSVVHRLPTTIYELIRHRYEINNDYREELEGKGTGGRF